MVSYDQEGQRTKFALYVPPGTHVARWQSIGGQPSIAQVRVLPMPGEISIQAAGGDFLIRVPRPEGLADSNISLQAYLPSYGGWWYQLNFPLIENSSAGSLTFRIPKTDTPSQLYRAAFTPP